jgi:NitT/TauT family transport system ATP-binding protein/sulfonate transport system ATP-binding protein
MLMVTHDIDEAIYLSQRIIIMSPRPGRISRILPVPQSYPRNRASSDFTALRSEILTFLNYAHEVKQDYTI